MPVPARAQVADASVSIATTSGSGGAVTADARCFEARGPVLGQPCAGELTWTLERCDEAGCVPREFRTTRWPWRVVFHPTKRGLYRLRVLTDLGLLAELDVRQGPLP